MTLVRILASSASDLQVPALRRAEVKSVSANSIEMTLYCASDGSSDTLTPVSAELHPSRAIAAFRFREVNHRLSTR